MKDYAKRDMLKDIEVDGEVGGFKGDFWVCLALMVIIVLIITL